MADMLRQIYYGIYRYRSRCIIADMLWQMHSARSIAAVAVQHICYSRLKLGQTYYRSTMADIRWLIYCGRCICIVYIYIYVYTTATTSNSTQHKSSICKYRGQPPQLARPPRWCAWDLCCMHMCQLLRYSKTYPNQIK